MECLDQQLSDLSRSVKKLKGLLGNRKGLEEVRWQSSD